LYVDAPEPAVASIVKLLAVRVTFLETNAFVFTTATLTATATPIPEVASVVGGSPTGAGSDPSSAKLVTAPTVVRSFSSPLAVLR
jgi:hypothetical protein